MSGYNLECVCEETFLESIHYRLFKYEEKKIHMNYNPVDITVI